MNIREYFFEILAVLVIIPSLGFMIKKIIDWLRIEAVDITINVPSEILTENIKFGLLHVRDGKDKSSEKGAIKNKVRWFKKIDKKGNLKTTVSYSKNLGFQFKCFLDYEKTNFEYLKEMLEEKGFTDISMGKGKTNRIWFIHPGFAKCVSLDGITNNFFYPE